MRIEERSMDIIDMSLVESLVILVGVACMVFMLSWIFEE